MQKMISQFKDNYFKLLDLIVERDLLKEDAGVSGIEYSGVSSSTKSVSSLVENTVIPNLEKKAILDGEILELKSQLVLVAKFMQGLSDTDRKIVKCRLIDGNKWYEISRKIGLSERQCQRRLNEAIRK